MTTARTARTPSLGHLAAPSTTLLALPPLSARAMRAHAIKNCACAMVATAALLEREVGSSNPESTLRLRKASDRLRALLHHDLQEGEPAPRGGGRSLCVVELARAVQDRLVDCAALAHVRLTVLSEPGALRGDEEALGEALLNLVSNAIDATPAGGTVSLSMRLTLEGDHLWTIQDSGCGMAPDQLAELGRPFRSRKEGGSGLGISIAQAAIAAHGGLLRVESRENAGSTFTAWLPRS